jgi:hypothetical protein
MIKVNLTENIKLYDYSPSHYLEITDAVYPNQLYSVNPGENEMQEEPGKDGKMNAISF